MATTRFDDWEGEYLAHFRTKGSKNGVRRYQQEDGTWTPLGLRERKAREGWGDGDERSTSRAEKKAAKAEAKAEKKAAKAEAKAERAAVRAENIAALKEKRRLNDVSQLSDAELKAKIERVKMEQEYKELTKSPLLKAGETLVSNYLTNKALKAERAYEEKKSKVEYEREMSKLKEVTEQKKLQSEADKSRSEADKSRAEADKARAETDKVDIQTGTRAKTIKYNEKQLKLQNKRFVSDNTIRGGLKKMVNKILSGKGDADATYRKGSAEADVAYKKGKTDVKIALTQAKKLNEYNNSSKVMPWDKQASIPEGGFTQYATSSNSDNGEKNKKKNKNK